MSLYICLFCVFSIYTGTPALFIFHVEKILCVIFSHKTICMAIFILETHNEVPPCGDPPVSHIFSLVWQRSSSGRPSTC